MRDDDEIQPWDSDHTALVHVLWAARRDGVTIEDADQLASRIMSSKWMRALHQHVSERWESRQAEGWVEAERAENARLRKVLADIAVVDDYSMAVSLACAALALERDRP